MGKLLGAMASLLSAATPNASPPPEVLDAQVTTIRAVREIALSPDGRTVASVITEPTAAGGHSHIWLLSVGRPPRRLISAGWSGDTDDIAPIWRRDGRTLMYLERSHGQAVVKRIPLSAGAADTLRLGREGDRIAGGWQSKPPGVAVVAKGFAESATGVLALWAADGIPTPDPAQPGSDLYVFGTAPKVRLYIVPAAGAPTEIAIPDDVRTTVWHRDGRRLLVVTQPSSDDLGDRNRLWLIDGDQPPREVPTAADVSNVSWLPDGRIAYTARCRQDAPTICRDVFVQGLDGSTPVDLTADLEGTVIDGVENGSVAGPVVTADGDILVAIARGFEAQVARIRPADGRTTWADAMPPVVRSVTANIDGTALALIAAERGAAPTVWLANRALERPIRVDPPALQPTGWKPLKPRPMRWMSEGRHIEGLLYLPLGAAPDRRVPLVVDVHGGPAGRFENVDYPLVRLLLARGWAVLHMNPRGSLGYGADFLASLKDDMGGGDFRDLMAGIDVALANTSLDPDKLAMIGYSYGGTTAAFANGRTRRFRALVSVAPVTDQFSEYGTEGSSWYDRWYFGKPWRRFEAAWRQSPLSVVAEARTPLLLFQGEQDTSDPPGQSQELYRALRQEGVATQLVMLPRESHRDVGANFYGYPSVERYHGLALRERLVAFVAAAFGGDHNGGLPPPVQIDGGARR